MDGRLTWPFPAADDPSCNHLQAGLWFVSIVGWGVAVTDGRSGMQAGRQLLARIRLEVERMKTEDDQLSLDQKAMIDQLLVHLENCVWRIVEDNRDWFESQASGDSLASGN